MEVPVVAHAAPAAAPAASTRRPLARGWVAAATGVGVGVVAIAALMLARRNGHSADAPTVSRGVPVAAVLPFEVRGDSTRAFLGEALSALLSGRLDAPGVLRTLESNAVLSAVGEKGAKQSGEALARATALGAHVLVSGTVVALGDRLEIDAELRRTDDPTQRVIRANVSGSPDSLFALADRLGATLLVAFDGRVPGNASMGGTTSVPALKALLLGEENLRAWRLRDAAAAYRAAIAIDSTYALAWYRLALAENWSLVGDRGADAQRHVVRLASRLPDRYALLVQAHVAQQAGDFQTAEHTFLTVVQRYPDDGDPWSELGEYRMHVGPLFGQPTTNAEAPLLRALALDSVSHPEARWHLAQLALERGDRTRATALLMPLAVRSASGDPTVRTALVMLAMSNVSTDTITSLVEVLRDMPAPLAGRMLRQSMSSAGVTPLSLALAESLAVTPTAPSSQREGLAVVMEINAALRRWPALDAVGRELAASDSLAAADAWAAVAQGPEAEARAEVWRASSGVLERAARRDSSPTGWTRLVNASVMAVRANDREAFTRLSSAFAQRSGQSGRRVQILSALRAFAAQASGDTAAATRELRDMRGPVDWQFARWLRAAWLERTGSYEDAERWYLSTPWGPLSTVMTRPALESAARMERLRKNQTASDTWTRAALRFAHAEPAR